MGYLDGLDDDLSPSTTPAPLPPRPPTNGSGNGHGRLPPNAQAVGSYLDLLNSSLDADLDEEVAPTLPWEDPTNPLVQLAARGQALLTPANQPSTITPAPVVAAAGEAVRTGAYGAARAIGEGAAAIPRNIGTTIRALGEQATARAGMPAELAPGVEIPSDPLTAAAREYLGTALIGVGGALETTFTSPDPATLPPSPRYDDARAAAAALETLQAHPVSRFATDVLQNAPQVGLAYATAGVGAPGAAAGILGAQAAGAGIEEAERQGATPEQAITAGVGQGAMEFLGERVALGKLSDLIQAAVGGNMKTARRALGGVLSQASVEFTQEALTSVAQRVTDLAAYKAERGESFTLADIGQALYEGGIGFALGGVGGAVAVAPSVEEPLRWGRAAAPAAPAAPTQLAVAPTTPPPRSVFAQPVRGGEVTAAPPPPVIEQAQPPAAEAGEAAAGTPVSTPVDEAPPPPAAIAPPEVGDVVSSGDLNAMITAAQKFGLNEQAAELHRRYYREPESTAQPLSAPSPIPPADRRTDLATRRRVADMSPADMARTLLTDELTGLGNRRAYEEAGYDQQNAQASVDLDSLKWINDNLGHDQGDEVLRKVGQAFRETNVPGFRFGGDEFRVAAETDEDLDAHLQRVSDHLRAAGPLTYIAPDGTTYSVPVELTYGTATGFDAFAEADRQLIAAKAGREARGERAGRGEKPPGVVVEPAAGGQVGVAGRGERAQAEGAEGSEIVGTADRLFPRAGGEVDGRKVRAGTPNYSSIDATLGDVEYDVLDGVREIPMSTMDPDYAVERPDKRTRELAEAIRQSGEINPLIVVVDSKGPYILEGGHRYDALKLLGAKSFPAVVALESSGRPDAFVRTPQREEVTPSAQQEGSAQAQAAETQVPAAPVATDTRAAVEPTQPPAAVEPVPVTATAPNEQSSVPATAVRETPADVQRTPTPVPAAPAEAPTARPDRRSEVTTDDLVRTIRQLSAEIDRAYEDSDADRAEELEAQLAEAEEDLDSRLEATDEGGDSGGQATTAGVDVGDQSAEDVAIEEEFAGAWGQYAHGGSSYAPSLDLSTPDALASHLREIAKDAETRGGGGAALPRGLRGNVTDAALLEAAEDIYSRRVDLRRRYVQGAEAGRDKVEEARQWVESRKRDREASRFTSATDTLDRQLVRASERLRQDMESGGLARSISADQLMDTVGRETGGSLAAGTFTAKDAYDALELAVNTRIASRGKADARAGTSLIDAKTRILALDEASSRLPTQTRRTGESDSFQQFSTPPAYAYLANWAAALTPADIYLEPSAGTGGLLSIAKASGVSAIYANELAPRRAHMLTHPDLGVERVFSENAEQLDNALPPDIQPTVVVMNPPFSQTAGRMGDKVVATTGATHVEQALRRLAPGGRLVAIVGGGRSNDPKAKGGMRMDAPSYRGWWRRVQSQYNVRANVGIPGRVYRKNGTTFETRLLVIDKTGPQQGAVETTDATSLVHALAILETIRDERQPITRVDDGRAAATPTTEPARVESRARADGRTRRATAAATATAEPAAAPTAAARTPKVEAATPTSTPTSPTSTPSTPTSAQVTSLATPSRTSTGELTDSIYEPYRPSRLRIPDAPPHPTALVESAAMSSVDPPPTSYVPSFTRDFIERGGPNGKPPLSLEQLEFTVYAGEAHSQMLPAVGDVPARRRGIMGGDGTGAGKGRQVASVILDNWNQGRKKSVWVSEKQRLIEDARRDWTALGGRKRDIISNKQVKADESIGGDQGIFFTTYDTLRGRPTEKAVREAAEKGKVAQSRVDQLVDWLGEDFDGVIVFDESHNMGNAVDMKGSRGTRQASQKAKAGMELQDRLPNARVIYMSATAATEVANLAYADRLGLWGPGTAFGDRRDFVTKIESGGVGIMEAVARDLKALGSYIARSLAFSDGTELGTVQYARQEHELTADQVEVYNVLADAWQLVLDNVHLALKETTSDSENAGRARASAMSAFWGANQRFFNQVLTSMQMPLALREMKRDLAEGRSVVVQLVNTLEASQERQLAARAEDEDLEEFDLTPRDQLMEYIKKSFPVAQLEEYEDDNGNVGMRPVRDSNGNLVENREAAKMRDRLLDKLAMIRVPQSPLDMVIEQLGGPGKVAEVTGRGRRLVRNADNRMVIEPRSSAKNQADVAAFQDGKKRVLIFTAAGGTGASYHASNEVNNRERRAHYLLQAGWRADQALQGFGRTHRTDQASAPVYKLISTNLPGHRRFISSIARRLDQLGALTSGQRETARRGVFAEKDNLEGRTASDALRLFYYDVVAGKVEGLSLDDFTAQTGLRLVDSDGKPLKVLPPITQFLNRLLSMRTDVQERVFRAFETRWDAVTEIAIQRGELDVGTETIRGEKIEKLEDRKVYSHPTGAETRYVKLRIWRKTSPVSYEVAARKAGGAGEVVAKAQVGRGYRATASAEAAKGEFAQNRRTGRLWSVVGHATRTDESGKVETVSRLLDPSGAHLSVTNTELYRLYETTTPEQAKGEWEKQVAAVPALYPRDEHMLVGVLLPIWDRISSESKKVYRLRTDDGEVLLGRSIDPPNVSATLKALGAGTPTLTPDRAVERLMEGDVRVELANRWKLERSRVADEWRLELKIGYDDLYSRRQELEAVGLFLERHNYSMRVFVPTGERAVEVYRSLTRLYPVADVVELGGGGRGDDGGGGGGADAGAHGHGEDTTTEDRGNEGGFISTKPLADLLHWAKGHLTASGYRPESLDLALGRMKWALAAHTNRLDALARDLDRAKRNYKGPLKPAQLDRYLDDALRGMNLRTGSEALDEVQVKRIAAARGVAPEAIRARLAERVPLAWAGLRHAPEFAPLLREIRDRIDMLARDMRRIGRLNDGMARELERHYGLYVHRQYEAFHNPKFLELMRKTALWGRAVELTQARFPGKSQEQIEGMLVDYVGRTTGRTLLPGGHPAGAEDLSIVLKRNELADLNRMLLGEVRSATPNMFSTAFAMARIIEEQKFRDAVVEVGPKEGWLRSPEQGPAVVGGVDVATQIDPTWRATVERGKPVPNQDVIGSPPGLDHLTVHRSKERSKDLGGYYTTKDIYDELTGVLDHEDIPKWLAGYMLVNAGVKWGATAGSPQSQARNFISGFLSILSNGVSPLNVKRGVEAAKVSYPRVYGSTNRAMLDVAEDMIRRGLFDQGTDLGDMKRMVAGVQRFMGEEGLEFGARRGYLRAIRFASEHYNAGDNFAKMYVFSALVPQYRDALPNLTDEQVKDRVASVLRRTMQNYGSLPRAIRYISSRVAPVAPFLSFNAEVVRNVKNIITISRDELESDNEKLRAIAHRRMAGLSVALSIPTLAGAAMAWLLGSDPEDEEPARRFVYPWARNGPVTVLPSPPGTLSYFDWGFMDYFALLKQPVYAAMRGEWDEALTDPAMKAFGEEILFSALIDVLYTNEKSTGGEVYNPEDTLLAKLTASAAYLAYVAQPGAGRTAARVHEAAFDEESSKQTWQELLAIAGPRVTTIDLRKAVRWRSREFMERIYDARRLELKPKVGDQERGGEKAQMRLQEIAESLAADLLAARKLGTTEDELREAMSSAVPQVPNWAQDALLNSEIGEVVDHYRELNRERMDEEAEEAEDDGTIGTTGTGGG